MNCKDGIIRQAVQCEREIIKKFVCDIHIATSGYNAEATEIQLSDLPFDFPELFHENLWNPSLCWVCTTKSILETIDDLMGCIGIRIADDKTVYIVFLYVSFIHRRKGIARRLLKLVIDWSRINKSDKGEKYSAITLFTLKDLMTNAVQLYQSEGFRIVDENSFTYFCVLTMQLDL